MAEQFEEGAFTFENGMTLPYLWSALHLNAQMEQKLLNKPRFEREGERFSRELEALLSLLKGVEAEQWMTLCHAAGLTVFGVVGLSWCKNATAEMLWAAWDNTPYDLLPEPASERPLQLINRGLMPETSMLTEIVSACNNNGRRACLAISALKGTPLAINIAVDIIERIHSPLLKAFVEKRQQVQCLELNLE